MNTSPNLNAIVRRNFHDIYRILYATGDCYAMPGMVITTFTQCQRTYMPQVRLSVSDSTAHYRRSGNFLVEKFSRSKFLPVLFLPHGKVSKTFYGL